MFDPLALVLFSGSDDTLQATSILAGGASAMGRPVNVLLQFWALDAFRSDRVQRDHGLAPEAGVEGARIVRDRSPEGRLQWLDTFRQAQELGEVSIQACSASMDLLGLDVLDLDPDGACGVATFLLAAEDGQIVFS